MIKSNRTSLLAIPVTPDRANVIGSQYDAAPDERYFGAFNNFNIVGDPVIGSIEDTLWKWKGVGGFIESGLTLANIGIAYLGSSTPNFIASFYQEGATQSSDFYDQTLEQWFYEGMSIRLVFEDGYVAVVTDNGWNTNHSQVNDGIFTIRESNFDTSQYFVGIINRILTVPFKVYFISPGELVSNGVAKKNAKIHIRESDGWKDMSLSIGTRKGWVNMGPVDGWRPLHTDTTVVGEFFQFDGNNDGVRGYELQWITQWAGATYGTWDKPSGGSFEWKQAFSNGHQVNLAVTQLGGQDYLGIANMWYTVNMYNFSLSDPNTSSGLYAHKKVGAATGIISDPESGNSVMTLPDHPTTNGMNHLTVTDAGHPIHSGYGAPGGSHWTLRSHVGTVFYGTCPQMVGFYPRVQRYSDANGGNYEVKEPNGYWSNWNVLDLPNAPQEITSGFCLMDAYASNLSLGNTVRIGNCKGRSPVSVEDTFPLRLDYRLQTSTTPCHFWTQSQDGQIFVEPVGGFPINYWKTFTWSGNPINHNIEVIPCPELGADFVNIIEHSFRHISSGGNTGRYPLDNERHRSMSYRRTLFTYLPSGGNTRFVDTSESIGVDGDDGQSYMGVCHGGFPVKGTSGNAEYFVFIESRHSSFFDPVTLNLKLAAANATVYRKTGAALNAWERVHSHNHYLTPVGSQLLGTMFKRTSTLGDVAVLSKVQGLFGDLEEYNKPSPENNYTPGRMTVRTAMDGDPMEAGEFLLAGPFFDDDGDQFQKVIYAKFEEWFELQEYIPPSMDGENPPPAGGHQHVLCTHTGELTSQSVAGEGNLLYMGRCGWTTFQSEPKFHGYYTPDRVCPFELANWQVMPKESDPGTWVFAISGICEVERVMYQDGLIAGQPNMVPDGSLRILDPTFGSRDASTVVIEVPIAG